MLKRILFWEANNKYENTNVNQQYMKSKAENCIGGSYDEVNRIVLSVSRHFYLISHIQLLHNSDIIIYIKNSNK